MFKNRINYYIKKNKININSPAIRNKISEGDLYYLLNTQNLDNCSLKLISDLANCINAKIEDLVIEIKVKLTKEKYTNETICIVEPDRINESIEDYIYGSLEKLYSYDSPIKNNNEKIVLYKLINPSFSNSKEEVIKTINIDWSKEYMKNVFKIMEVENRNGLVEFLCSKYDKEKTDMLNLEFTRFINSRIYINNNVSKFINDKCNSLNFLDYVMNYVDYCNNQYRGNLVF